ncbi:MAG TPA: EAL domain-containing protein [Eoetvoesiella sp.]
MLQAEVNRLKNTGFFDLLNRLFDHFAFRGVPVTVVAFAALTLFMWENTENFGPGSFHTIYLLEGGILTLSLIVLIFAAINRSWLYVLFAAWLVGNLRITALSMGWDTEWIGQAVPYEHLPLVRKLTIAIYYILNYTLFSELFKADLANINFPRLQRTAQWAGIALLGCACFIPYEQFLPIMWALAGLGFVIALFLVIKILITTQSDKAFWYSASLGVVLVIATGISNILANSFGITFFNGAVIHVAAALTSSAIVAVVIAENLQAERRERAQTQAEVQGIYEVTPVGLFTLEANGSIARSNPAFKSMLAFMSPQTPMARWADYFGLDSWIRLKSLAVQHKGGEMEIQNIALANGTERRNFWVKVAVANTRIEGSLQDITERADTITKLRMLANHDPLTNALNQRGIENKLNESLTALITGEPFALAYVDLKSLKTINDLYGHSAGDDVLRQACNRFQAMLTGTQMLGRISGGEFVILFQNSSVEAATNVSQQILDDLQARPCQIGTQAFRLRGSIGLVEITTPQMNAQEAITAAARAARAAKRGRQNQLVVHHHNAQTLAEHNKDLRLIRELGSGLSPQRLFLEMQPIMSLRRPFDTLNFEVLLRMHDSNGALVPAPKIIAAAEESGTIAVIDKWVVNTTLQWLDAHQQACANTQFVCINLSGMSLNDETFIEDFFAILSQYEHLVHLLCIEVTESVALHDLENTRRFILRLQRLGVRVALDDFGAGYTSFSYLKDLPADALKIDGAFIQSINDHPANRAIVEAIVALARNLGMKSIAEWVEDSATLITLHEMGVDYVQGYVIARPQSTASILAAKNGASFITDENTRLFLNSNIAQTNLGFFNQPTPFFSQTTEALNKSSGN